MTRRDLAELFVGGFAAFAAGKQREGPRIVTAEWLADRGLHPIALMCRYVSARWDARREIVMLDVRDYADLLQWVPPGPPSTISMRGVMLWRCCDGAELRRLGLPTDPVALIPFVWSIPRAEAWMIKARRREWRDEQLAKPADMSRI